MSTAECPKCGATVDRADEFCPNCNLKAPYEEVISGKPNFAKTSSSSETDTWVWVLVGVGVCFLLCCVVGQFIESSSPGSSTSPASEGRSRPPPSQIENEPWYPEYKQAYQNENFEKAARIYCRNNPGCSGP